MAGAMRGRFWSSLDKASRILPKRDFLGIGIIDFVQPFLIQSMTKPGFTSVGTKTSTLVGKNGSIQKRAHYTSDYRLSDVRMSIIDSHEENVLDPTVHVLGSLNTAATIYQILTSGGYTSESTFYDSEMLGMDMFFPALTIVELKPGNKPPSVAKRLLAGGLNIMGQIGAGEDPLTAITTGAGMGESMAGGMWTLYNPVITSVNFGNINYGSEAMTKIDLTMAYNNFKYEESMI